MKRIRIAIVLLAVSSVLAGHLPERRYTISEGLANDNASRILADSRGFLWACTPSGLSRFDGREFVTYNTRNGLSAKTVTDIVENPDGTYYVSLWDNQITLFDPSKTDRSKLFHSITV